MQIQAHTFQFIVLNNAMCIDNKIFDINFDEVMSGNSFNVNLQAIFKGQMIKYE